MRYRTKVSARIQDSNSRGYRGAVSQGAGMPNNPYATVQEDV